jgi:hypothetical protein
MAMARPVRSRSRRTGLLGDVAANGNLMFTDVTINTGVTLTVPSGLTIRATGTFTNNGTIVIQTAAFGGSVFAIANPAFPSYAPPHPGHGIRIAASGELGDATANRVGGSNSLPPSLASQRYLLRPGVFGGGGGAPLIAATNGAGAAGGAARSSSSHRPRSRTRARSPRIATTRAVWAVAVAVAAS